MFAVTGKSGELGTHGRNNKPNGKMREQPGNDQGVGAVTMRRFPAPWSVRELEQAFVVVDANGQAHVRPIRLQ